MKKELMQMIAEAGIVPPQAVHQLKSWKQLSVDVPEEGRPLSREDLVSLLCDLERLLEKHGELPELRETSPGLEAAFSGRSQSCVVALDAGRQTLTIDTSVLVEGVNAEVPAYFIFKAAVGGLPASRVGNQICLGGDKIYEITEASPLYCGEAVSFYKCSVQEVPENAQMSELRGFCK